MIWAPGLAVAVLVAASCACPGEARSADTERPALPGGLEVEPVFPIAACGASNAAEYAACRDACVADLADFIFFPPAAPGEAVRAVPCRVVRSLGTTS